MTLRMVILVLASLVGVSAAGGEPILVTLTRATEASEAFQLAQLDLQSAQLGKSTYRGTWLPAVNWDASTASSAPGLLSLGFSSGLGSVSVAPEVSLTQRVPGGGLVAVSVVPNYSRLFGGSGSTSDEYYSTQLQWGYSQPLTSAAFVSGRDLDDIIADLTCDQGVARSALGRRAAARAIFDLWRTADLTSTQVESSSSRLALAWARRERARSLSSAGAESASSLVEVDRSVALATLDLELAVLRNRQARELFSIETGFPPPSPSLDELESIGQEQRPYWLSLDQYSTVAVVEANIAAANLKKQSVLKSPELRVAGSLVRDNNLQISFSVHVGIRYSSGMLLNSELNSNLLEAYRQTGARQAQRALQRATNRTKVSEAAADILKARVGSLRDKLLVLLRRNESGHSLYSRGAITAEELAQMELDTATARSELRATLWDLVNVILFGFE